MTRLGSILRWRRGHIAPLAPDENGRVAVIGAFLGGKEMALEEGRTYLLAFDPLGMHITKSQGALAAVWRAGIDEIETVRIGTSEDYHVDPALLSPFRPSSVVRCSSTYVMLDYITRRMYIDTVLEVATRYSAGYFLIGSHTVRELQGGLSSYLVDSTGASNEQGT